MFDLGAETMVLPLEEKQKFAVIAAGPGVSFGLVTPLILSN